MIYVSSPVNVHMPKDRVTQSHQGYGFVEFLGEDDADYAIKIMNMIKLYGKPIRVNKVRCDKKNTTKSLVCIIYNYFSFIVISGLSSSEKFGCRS